MKWILAVFIMIAFSIDTRSQVTTGVNQPARSSKKLLSERKAAAGAKQRGSGQYHGSRDTTPGSPMGTGGTGEGDMSGSPAASEIETKDQTTKAAVSKDAPPLSGKRRINHTHYKKLRKAKSQAQIKKQ